MYVDDIILAGKTEKKLAKVKTKLSRKFDINNLGELIQKYFFGIKIEQRETTFGLVNLHTRRTCSKVQNARLQISCYTTKHWLQAQQHFWIKGRINLLEA